MSLHKLLTLSGWALVRILHENDESSDHEVYWEPRWVALESGSLFFYLDETQVYPENMTALLECSVRTTRQLENGETILTIKGQNMQQIFVSVELGIKEEELPYWQQAIDMHVGALLKAGTVLSPADLTMDDVESGEDTTMASSIHMTVKGETYTVVVTPEDDAKEVARQFIADNEILMLSGKDGTEKSIEIELLKAQVSGCLMRENKLRKQMSQIRRRLGDVAIAEARAARAEQHASTLACSLLKIELIVPQIHSQLNEARKAVVERDMEIARLSRQLKDEENYIHLLAKESDDMADELQVKAEESRRIQAERDALKEDLEELMEHLNDPARSAAAAAAAATESSQSAAAADESNAVNSSSSVPNELRLLRKEKVDMTRALRNKEEENKKLELDLKMALNLKASKRITGKFTDASVDEPKAENNGGEKLAIARRLAQLEEKNRSLTGSMKASEDSRKELQSKHDEFQSTFHHGQAQLKETEKELQRTANELRELKLHATVRNYDGVVAENRTLRDELIKFRGEVLRLQTSLDEVQSSAAQAAQSFQMLGASASFAPTSPTPDRGRSSRRVVAPSREESAVPEYYLDLSARSPSPAVSGTGMASPALTVFGLGRTHASMEGGGNISAELRNAREENVKYIWEPNVDVASARISPVVEERLLHDIYYRYTGEAGRMGNTLTLGRFGRFTKEFGISIIAKGGTEQPPFLVSGEIDVIFLNATQATPQNLDLPSKSPRAFGVRAGAGTVKQYLKTSPGTSSSAPVLSLGQFVVAVKVLACQLYSNVIEHETGIVLECLPPRQKEAASRAVMDVLMKKKIMPKAEKLGIIPWPLIYLDQTMTSLASYVDASKSLSRNFQQVFSWFSLYKSAQHSTGPTAAPLEPYMTYKDVSRFAHNFGYVPYLLKEPQLFR